MALRVVVILPKPMVGVLASGIEVRSALRAELDGTVSVRYCETGEALVEVAAEGGLDAAVLELWDRNRVSNLPLVSRLLERAPEVRIAVWFAPTPAAFREAAAALAAGASECAVRGYDRLSRVIRTMLAHQRRPGASLMLLARLEPLIPDDLKEYAVACALKASPRLTAARLAEWIRVKERTLRARCQRDALCAPSVFIDYSVAVHAAALLDLYGLEPDAGGPPASIVRRPLAANGRLTSHAVYHGNLQTEVEEGLYCAATHPSDLITNTLGPGGRRI